MHLSGLRVIDLTRVLSGPFCAMLLGDLGADVIKVEAPDGDPIRSQGLGRDGISWYFAGFNRNKRAITLDLKTEDGRAVLERLIAGADALVENFRPGVLERLGFGEKRLQEIRPGLVTCAISGFGASGPYRDRPAFDFIAQAMSGFMSVTGGPDDPPLRTGMPISDLVAGLYGALAVTAALLGRERSGATGATGERIDVALTDGMTSLLAYCASNYFVSGAPPMRSGNDHPISSPYGMFRTADGEIAIAPAVDTIYARLVDALGMPELKSDPDFLDNRLRVTNRLRLNALIETKLVQQPSAHWIELLNAAGVPCGRVNDMHSLFTDPQVLHQEMAIDVDHPGHGTVRMLGFPMKLASAPCAIRHPAPDQGQHTDDLLAELGYGEAEVARLRAAGAIA